VSIRVIDLLEAIQIDDDGGDRRLGLFARCDSSLRRNLDGPAIEQARERISRGLYLQVMAQ